MPKIYLASPLGFSPELKPYLDKVKLKIFRLGYEIFDPWAQGHFKSQIRKASQIQNYYDRLESFAQIARGIGALNEDGVRSSDMLLGILDGSDVDSGTAVEIGYAAGIGLKCFGLRTDWREAGDLFGLPINLQVLHFIEKSGGRLFRSIKEIDFENS
jgi:nucleoside 2-deoxyribosyltransferase